MKRFSTILAALALVVLMQGCGKDPSTEPELPNNPDTPTQSAVQLRLKGDIATITPPTRVNANGFEANDNVGVYISATGSLATSDNMLDNEAFTYSSGNITAPEGKEVYWGSEDVRLSVWAYYPYVTTVSDNAAYPFAVNTNQTEAADYYNSDFITAQASNLAPQTTPVELTFAHSLSKIIVTLAAGEGITTEALTSAEKSLSISGAIVDGTIDLADGTATAGTTKEAISLYALDGLNYAAIVYPQQSEISFRIELGDDVYAYSAEVEYEAGTQYQYTFTLDTYSPQSMSLTSTTISNWIDDENPTEETLSNIITFADQKFKEYLLNGAIYEWDENRYVATDKKIDANNDREISIAEAEKVEYIAAYDLGISDMTELHYFPNLKYLNCGNNELTSLDISRNTALNMLYCDRNQLTSLNVSNNTALAVLSCGGNQLTTLDVSNNTELTKLVCKENQLSTLDVTRNTKLTSLNCSSTSITTLDVSKNTELTSLTCTDNNSLTELDITKNTKLTYLACTYCPIESLDVTKNTALESLYCRCNLTTLNLSYCTALKYFDCIGNKLTTLDLSNLSALKRVVCDENLELSSINLYNCTALEELYCGGGQLTTLDVSSSLALRKLSCFQRQNEQTGKNFLTKLYLATGQSIEELYKPNETAIEYK